MTSPDNTNDLDPDLAAALAEDDDEPVDPPAGDTVATADDIAARETEAQARRKDQHPRNKGGRPRKNRLEPIPPPKQPGVDGAPPVARRPMDMEGLWEEIIRRLQDRGIGGAEMVSIGLTQITLGAVREEPKKLNSIPGEAVAGTARRTPGEDLQDYLERAVHVPLNTGPARYRLHFRQRGISGGAASVLGVAEVTLPSAADIRKRWEATAQLQRDRERDNDWGAPISRGGGYATPPGYPAHHSYHHVDGAPTQPALPPVALPAQPGAPSNDAFYRAELDRAWAMYERERREAARLGQAPPAPPDPRMYAPPQPSKEDAKAETVALIVETLKAMGFAPPPAAPAVPPPAPNRAEVDRTVGDPFSGMERMFEFAEKFEKFKDRMRETFAPDEPETPPAPPPPPTATVLAEVEPDPSAMHPLNEQFARFDGDPIMWAKQAEGEGVVAYLSRLALGNPKIAGAVLERGAKMLDQSSFGKLVAAFTQMGGPQAQAARSAGNLQPPVVEQQLPANGVQRPGWTPNIG